MAKQALSYIVEQLCDDTAFLWQQRLHILQAADYELDEQLAHEQRLDNYLHALLAQGQSALEYSLQGLDFEAPGEYFCAAYLATQFSDITQLKAIINRGETSELLQAISAAIAWNANAKSHQALPQLLSGNSTEQCIAVMAIFAIGENPGQRAIDLLRQDEHQCQRLILQHAATLGLNEQHGLADYCAAEQAATVRLAAAQAVLCAANNTSLRLLAVDTLKALACDESDELWQSALRALLCQGELIENREWLRQQHSEQSPRWLAMAMGLCGDAQFIAPLCEQLQTPASHKLAAESLQLITGLDWHAQRLLFEDSVEQDEEQDELLPERDLPWLNARAAIPVIQQQANQSGSRQLLGKPCEPVHLMYILRHGRQRQRMIAQQLLVKQQSAGESSPAIAQMQFYWRAKQQIAYLAQVGQP